MKLDIGSIQNPQVRVFYSLYWSQHQILWDFYQQLTDKQYSYRMVDTPERKADTPRESLALSVLSGWWNYEDHGGGWEWAFRLAEDFKFLLG